MEAWKMVIKKENDFFNSFSISLSDAKELAKNYSVDWFKITSDTWIIVDNNEHVFTYSVSEGKLSTDIERAIVIDFILNR